MADILDKRPVDAEMTIFKTEVEPNKLNACIDSILMRLDRLETSMAQLVKHGHWDYSEKENGECAWYFCSECDSPAEQLYDDSPLLSELCPHCGVRMNDDVNIEASIEAQKSREQRRDNVKAIQERNLFETEVEGLYLNFEQDGDTNG